MTRFPLRSCAGWTLAAPCVPGGADLHEAPAGR